jgi:type III restriction enzyme
MHLLYEDLPHQRTAIDAVCDLFRGQEISRAEFTVTLPTEQLELTGVQQSDLGIGNRVSNTADDYLLANLREIQLRNGIPQAKTLDDHGRNFDVEMETGTGKTYVYLSSIFELNQRFGFTKFVIVVPSVAIKEGVAATLRDTTEHFRRKYNQLARHFVYDSARLSSIRDFATSNNIEIMVATVQSLYGGRTIFNNPQEKLAGEKPLDVVASTNPILIVDEPQSVEGTGVAGREALKALRPLCTLRYSATHLQHYNTVYKLDAIDAYEHKLVKQIEVAALTSDNDHNRPYIKLLRVEAKKNKPVRAELELDCERVDGVKREARWVYDGDKLDQTTGRLLYAEHVVGTIQKKSRDVPGSLDSVELRVPGDTRFLTLEEPIFGDTDEGSLAAAMIRRTIKEHLDKEKRLRPRGIKVLSLFFIKKVEDYRKPDGSPGPLAAIFEQEYAKLARYPEYNTLFAEVDVTTTATEVHNGYFSMDKKLITPFEGEIKLKGANQDSRDTETYNLIMREKTRLLDLKTPLKFIFSHSALREGWDNPNVFQICAFREMNQERERRQTIGRGLRLCVNQLGERIRGFDINTLTVVANETYQSFAAKLQHDIEQETGIRFGVVSQLQFAAIQTQEDGKNAVALGEDASRAIWQALRTSGYLDSQGKVTEALKKALDARTLELPAEFEPHRKPIEELLTKLAAGLVVRDADDKRPVIRLREAVLNSEEFRQLWERIRAKSIYRVQFDPDLLVRNCVRAIQELAIAPPTFTVRKERLDITRGGVVGTGGTVSAPEIMPSDHTSLPDLISELQDKTQLLRRTIVRILSDSGRLNDFRRNPNEFIRLVAKAVSQAKRQTLVDGVQYHRLSDAIYAQELFLHEELTGYLANLVPSTRSLYEQTVCDSDVEKRFVEEMEASEAVKLYVKLPGWFLVPTPLGNYNPDWAVLLSRNGEERLYFVLETKSSFAGFDLRVKEKGTIDCGRKHFKVIATDTNPAHFEPVRSLEDVFTYIHKN